VKLRRFGMFSHPDDMPMWRNFFSYQNVLTNLSLSVDLKSGTLSREFFTACSGTLTQLIIRGMFVDAFDCAWIQSCFQLKELCLQDLRDEVLLAPRPQIANVEFIPDGLLSLVLFEVVTLTQDIVSIVERLNKLNSIVIFKTGSQAGETGVDLPCLQKIFKCRNLNSCLLYRFLARTVEEVGQMLNMATTFHQLNKNPAPFRNFYHNDNDYEDIDEEDLVQQNAQLPLRNMGNEQEIMIAGNESFLKSIAIL